MLIKDPYLQSQIKNHELRSNPQHLYQNTSVQSQPVYSEAQRNRTHSTGQLYNLQAKVHAYERELKMMEQAYGRQGEAARKMLNFNEVNRQYHEAMNLRNFQLNTKLKETANDMQVTRQRYEEDNMRHTYDRDALLKKYQEQSGEVLRLRGNVNSLLQQKTRLEEELSHLSFIIEKEGHQHEMEVRQQNIRMQNFQRTYKNLLMAKDEEVAQLIQRLRLYENQNRKLVDINKTLMLTKDRPDKIDNLSQIHHPESNIKSHIKDRNKENDDANIPNSLYKQNQELKEMKTMNEQMRREMQNLKKQIEEATLRNSRLEKERAEASRTDRSHEGGLLETSKWQGMMSSIVTLRQAINKEIFELFCKSVRDGERRKNNSLVIFIQNWKCLDMERLEPYIKSYSEARSNLKQLVGTKAVKESVHLQKMEEVIPVHVGTRAGRNNINQWILSTIQFTKNQKQAGKKSMNNFLLFIFRLLTIEYRIKFPLQGKSYHIDDDVSNELMHEIIKAIEMIFKYN